MADKDYIQRLQRSYGDYRESNTTTETTMAIELRANVVAQSNKQQAYYSTLRKMWKEWDDSDNKVWKVRG